MKKSFRLLRASLSRLLPLSGCSSFFKGGNSVNQIDEVTTRMLDDGNTLVTITFTGKGKDPVTFILPCGETGASGNGIASIDPVVDKDGNVTVTINYTTKNFPATVFTIKAGRSITGYTTGKDEQTGDILLTFTYSDGTSSDPIRIPKGEKGEDGKGIKERKCEQQENGGQKITITFSDDTTTEFVISPAKGILSIQSSQNDDGERILTIYYTDGRTDQVTLPTFNTRLSGNGMPGSDLGHIGDFYFDLENNVIYQKESSGWSVVIDFKNQLGTTCTIEFRLNGDGGRFASSSFQGKVTLERGHTFYSDKIAVPLAVRDGYSFDGWYTSPTPDPNVNGRFTDVTNVYSDRTLYASWIKA